MEKGNKDIAPEIEERAEQEDLIEPETSGDESKTQDDHPCDDEYGLENQQTSDIEKRARIHARGRR
ncbi:hypothetical protein [Indiicoccus explosivorum]|uniref:hypothetical protein n=1 Tax=Indiicoccus explosivorum TaxID=1917864 RepID=UPI000B437948|nr:hypothetical protein [Indiicoccus explosivorum]